MHGYNSQVVVVAKDWRLVVRGGTALTLWLRLDWPPSYHQGPTEVVVACKVVVKIWKRAVQAHHEVLLVCESLLQQHFVQDDRETLEKVQFLPEVRIQVVKQSLHVHLINLEQFLLSRVPPDPLLGQILKFLEIDVISRKILKILTWCLLRIVDVNLLLRVHFFEYNIEKSTDLVNYFLREDVKTWRLPSFIQRSAHCIWSKTIERFLVSCALSRSPPECASVSPWSICLYRPTETRTHWSSPCLSPQGSLARAG